MSEAGSDEMTMKIVDSKERSTATTRLDQDRSPRPPLLQEERVATVDIASSRTRIRTNRDVVGDDDVVATTTRRAVKIDDDLPSIQRLLTNSEFCLAIGQHERCQLALRPGIQRRGVQEQNAGDSHDLAAVAEAPSCYSRRRGPPHCDCEPARPSSNVERIRRRLSQRGRYHNSTDKSSAETRQYGTLITAPLQNWHFELTSPGTTSLSRLGARRASRTSTN